LVAGLGSCGNGYIVDLTYRQFGISLKEASEDSNHEVIGANFRVETSGFSKRGPNCIN
jgi:hypothetical protein